MDLWNYAAAMATRSNRPQKLYRWRIARIRSTPAEIIGYVEAPDAETAIKEAIREYEITDPEKQKRLIAQRME
jgi:hypothetical protein